MSHGFSLVALALLSACGSSGVATPDAASDSSLPDASNDGSVDGSTPPADAPVARGFTWENGEVPATGPVGRWGYMVAAAGDGMAYVYGGTTLTNTGSGSVSNDLWRVDGRGAAPVFTRLTVTGEAPPRYCGCLGYIPTTRTLVMIGGRNPAEAPAETWALPLDTMAWSRVPTSATPGGVIGCALGWSTARGALYHFGGGMATGFSASTSRFDPEGSRWVTLPATGPRGRYDDAFAPLPDGRRFVMVAGARGATAGPAFLNDTWIFDAMSESWEPVTIEGVAPPGRRNPWVSVDADGNGLLLAMGSTGIQAGQVLADTWHLDLVAHRWTSLDLATLPDARGFIAAVPGRGAVRGFLLGGFDNERVLRDVWSLREE